MTYSPNNYGGIDSGQTVNLDVDGVNASVSLLWCRECGCVVADPERHDLVDCGRPLNP